MAWTVAVLIVALTALDLATSGSEPASAPRPVANHAFASRPDLAPPILTAGKPRAGTSPGFVFVAPKRRSGQSGPAILDARGEYVWFKPMPKGTVADDFRVQTYKGAPVLTWWEGKTSSRGYGQGTWVVADSAYREIARIRAGNGLGGDLHELVLTEHGTRMLGPSAARRIV